MIEIYNFNDCPLSFKNGSYGGMTGSKDGIIFKGEEWMLKYPKNLSQMGGENASYSTAPLSEYLGSHIYEILEYETHQTLLGEKNEKIVVACKDFAIDKLLLEIRTLKNHTGTDNPEILEKVSSSSENNHSVNLEGLLLLLDKNPVMSKISGIKERFFEQAIIDIFINNNDRNNGNWGILRERGKADTLAPVFDNGSCFSTKISEDKIKRLLSSSELCNNAINVLTAYGKNGHNYSAKNFFEEVRDIPEYKNAVLRLVPLIQKKLPEIKSMMDDIPVSYKTSKGTVLSVLSDIRRKYYQIQLDIRLEKLLLPEYNRQYKLLLNKKYDDNKSYLDFASDREKSNEKQRKISDNDISL